MPARLKVAIVHDALVNTGGAERVLTYIHEAFPDAPIFTSVYLPEQTYDEFRHATVITLPGSRLACSERQCKQLFLLWLLGFLHLDLRNFDVVLSSTTWGAKFIRPGGSIQHASYCYAPFRLLWKPKAYSPTSLPVNRWEAKLVDSARTPLRRLDYQVTQSISRLATTCGNIAREIATCYRRQAQVIYAPIRLADYHIGGNGDYYLTVSRIVSHKRVDLAVLACKALGRKLLIVGDGPERISLESMGDGTVQFVGRVSDDMLKDLYMNCRAVIFPSEEDYGLVPLEAQASGRPVIAYGSGGVLETVIENQTGIFFKQQTVEAVVEATLAFEKMQFDPQAIRQAVQRFDIEHFKRELREFVLNP